ncbi:pullulanase-type alpha-1,6-glucosidase [Candidatus Uabimicrobium sp. HlEnr_7]|uniref:pullulanase-type alpha-1,6-glucosidase n=1 Tax=Candidatus Uabimicrobium helgolandensis TaxID=3095367 RepID=UPI0035580DA3
MKKIVFLYIFLGWIMSQTTHLNIQQAKAYWLNSQTILCKLPQQEYINNCRMYHIENGDSNLTNSPYIELSVSKDKIAVPSYLKDYTQFTLTIKKQQIRELLQQQLIFTAVQNEQVVYATTLQTWGVLDQLFHYDGDLGVIFDGNNVICRLWAPTAKSVKLHLFDKAQTPQKQIFTTKYIKNGLWQVQGPLSWKNKFYLYEVEVFTTATNRIEKNMVTDPYSVSLAQNSKRSQIVDLNDKCLKPDGWDKVNKPILEDFTDISLYELHVRDFSINDSSISEKYRGTFMAFTEEKSFGMKHLKTLSNYGLSHVHLLPIFDIATINEDKSQQQHIEIPENLARDSEIPQKLLSGVDDGFNWGYDPFHYGVPEGSYATNPQGNSRIIEVRSMVQSLSKIGLRIVMDVVYNHTHASGQDSRSVLDKIVPGYYYRLDRNGYVQNSSCCPDTATERIMMEKLMVDTLLTWAKHYKIDGFRFDLMGHHTIDNLHNIRIALDKLTLDKDGVNGKKIYLYGEGWTFGSLHNIHPQKVMNQINARGTGIGTFNDRLRDTARGGNFQHHTRSDQGFVTGLFYDYNHCENNSEITADLQQQKQVLLNYANNIRISLAGGLADFPLYQNSNKNIYGYEIDYRGAPSGYTSQPYECINYISAHDNYTLWDQICAKATLRDTQKTTVTTSERIKMQTLGLSLVLLGQGIPFIHAGSEIARSKSGDGDSYNSGDWFNRLDFTYATNNWGVGLPCREKNYHEWDFWRPRLLDKNLRATTPDIIECFAQFLRLLKIRYSSKLFRLANAQQIIKRIKFLNVNSLNLPGVIVMLIDNSDLAFDSKYTQVIVAFNADVNSVKFSHELLKQTSWKIHPAMLEPVVISVAGQNHTVTSNFSKDVHYQELMLPQRSCTVYLQER